jgi:isopentenyl-diphosphate Delta-isomerase
MKYFDILDLNWNFTWNIKTREDVHINWYWHWAVHVWIINSKKQILIKKRPKTKEINPLKWDVSSWGHIKAWDDIVSAAIRETKEKLGIDVNEKNLKFLFNRKDSSVYNNWKYIDNEISYIFLLKLDIDEKKLILNKKEAIEVKFINLSDFIDKITNKDPDFINRYNEWKILFKVLANI